MLNWLKFISGSIVLDRDAKEAAQRKFWNVIFFLFMALIIMSFFFATGYNFAIQTHYDNSKDYQQAYEQIFNNNEFSCEINSKKLTCYLKDDPTTPVKTLLLDTTGTENGYEVIVDTREKDSHIEFTATYVNKNDENDKKTHLEYFAIKEAEVKKNYIFDSIEYTNVSLNYDPYIALADEYFVAGVEGTTEYLAIDKTTLTTEEVKKAQMNLFVKYALPEIVNDYGTAPVLNAYYAFEFLKTNQKKEFGYEHDRFILLLEESLTTAFVTEDDIFVFFEGTYRKFEAKFDFSPASVLNSKSKLKTHIETFVMTAYDDIGGTQTLNYIINIFRYMPFILLIMAALALFMFLLTRLSNDDYAENKFGGCFKIVAACSLGATLLTGIVGFILTFFMNQSIAFVISMSTFVSLLILRVLLLSIISFFRKRKENKLAQENDESSEETMELL